MKFIHAADIHLGSPFLGLRNATEDVKDLMHHSINQAFEKMITDAVAENVDFVLIVGDLFDEPNPSFNVIETAIDGFEKLNRANIPVLLSFGNHDYLNEEIPSSIFPDNVQVFDDKVSVKTIRTVQNENVKVAGFSYKARSEPQSRIDEYPVNGNDADYYIGTLHGSMDGLNSPEARYAPFTKDQLISKHYDYWALGHIHKRVQLNDNPLIQYSGNTQGRHINEQGVKGHYLVESNQKQLVSTFKPTSSAVWREIEINCDPDDTFDSLKEKIQSKLSKNHQTFDLVKVRLNQSNLLDQDVVNTLMGDVFLNRLQRELEHQESWIFKISLNTDEAMQELPKLDEDFWNTAKADIFNKSNILSLMGRLQEYDFLVDNFDSEDTVNELKSQSELQLIKNSAFKDEHHAN
ncbi:metallophosphoesterase family protein [Pediococcus argentinicus]|uniref:metallophosphoesterase family protein n=1 Tax=Pediococcus argentinicus TaxID=480391 RepID=UPI0007099C74|nr:DNA repair exonuclease [Pediococcus argentinicus]NKZ21991.1 DNA repair exonuclease [Pediococcus argentinicus]GEP19160.1 phosphoesterase [Pediococcus argentinicus]